MSLRFRLRAVQSASPIIELFLIIRNYDRKPRFGPRFKPCFLGMKNYYEELGVGTKATNGEIERSYLWLTQKFHPDKNEGFEKEAQARFIQIQEAFDILSDPVKRAQYDQELKSAWQYGAPPGAR